MQRVQILLSTYNGERYLAEQMDSLLAQDHHPLDVLVRDDGSTDSTLQILERYAHASNVRVVRALNVGAAQSFLELVGLSSPKADYFALCDQDDVWLPSKVSRAVGMLTELQSDDPAIYASRLAIVDEKLSPITLSAIPRHPPALGNALVETCLTGCTMVFNRAARDLLASNLPRQVVMHDTWIYLVLAAFGDIQFDPRPSILYRQHAANTIGVGPAGLHHWVWRARRFFKRKRGYTEQVQEFARLFTDRLSPQQRWLVDLVLTARTSFLGRLRLASTRSVFRQVPINDLLMRLVILANRL
jgi:glycosyltransferase involved in cell wall biosynthesis